MIGEKVSIRNILSLENIIAELDTSDIEDALYKVSKKLKESGSIENEDEAYQALIAREGLGSTCVGAGIAIPHAKIDSVYDVVALFAKISSGIDFKSKLTDLPVKAFFVLLSPKDSQSRHLKDLARISRILKNPNFMDDILNNGNSPSRILEIINRIDELENKID